MKGKDTRIEDDGEYEEGQKITANCCGETVELKNKVCKFGEDYALR